MMSLPYALFFYGGPIMMVLLIVFTSGAAVEHRRCRSRYHTDREMQEAERQGYRLGVKRGYQHAMQTRRQATVQIDVDRDL
jgi:hypothetical protein